MLKTTKSHQNIFSAKNSIVLNKQQKIAIDVVQKYRDLSKENKQKLQNLHSKIKVPVFREGPIYQPKTRTLKKSRTKYMDKDKRAMLEKFKKIINNKY